MGGICKCKKYFWTLLKLILSQTLGGSKEADANNDDLPLAIQTFLWRQTRFVKMHCHRTNNAQ